MVTAQMDEIFKDIVETIREPLLVLDSDLKVISASRSFYDFFKVKPEETVGQLIYDLGNKQWDIPKLRELLETILPEKTTFDNYEVEHDFATIGKRTMLLNARQIERGVGEERIILLAIEDITEHKRLEELLTESEERYRRIFDTASDGIVLLEKLEGHIVHANLAAMKMLGYTKEECIGKKLKNIGFPLAGDNIQDILQELDKHGIIYHDDVLVQTKVGQIFYADIYIVDRAKLLQFNVRDITERKKAEGALRKSEERMRTMFEETPLGMALIDSLTGQIYEVNPRFSEIVGRSRKEMATIDWMSITHPDDMQEDLDNMAQLNAGKITRFNMNKRYIKPDSSLVWVNMTIASITIEDKTQPRHLCMIEDITERRRAEEKQRESERRFQDIAQSMADWIWEVDKNGKYTYISDTVENILGYTPEALMGRTPFEIMPEEEAAKIKKIFLKIVSKPGPIVDLENWNLAKDGTKICLLTNGVPVFDSNREFIGYRGVDKDITNQKKLEAEKVVAEARLQQSQKMESIGVLAGGIAHDFNNILYPIIGFAEMSIDDLPENHPIKENLEDILRGAKRARDLVKQILMFSRQKVLEYKPLQIQDEIEDTLKLLRSVIPANIEIQKDLNEASDFIWGDPTEIHEIIMNLCTNAYHAMEETGGTLKVSLNKVKPDSKLELPLGEYCCLSVSDTGTGISPEIMDNIFEPYFTTKEVGKGSGLGLAVIHGIVKNHKGSISVESNPGKGTIFYVYLPLTSQVMESGGMPNLDKRGIGGSESILFVDDEEPIVKLGVRLLERFGYTVTGKTSCIEALALFGSEPDKFDLVITDMAMPCMTGTEFAKKLMEIRSDIPIVICTGFSERLDQEAAKTLGIMDYLHKPILINELSSKVRQVLDQAKKGVACQKY